MALACLRGCRWRVTPLASREPEALGFLVCLRNLRNQRFLLSAKSTTISKRGTADYTDSADGNWRVTRLSLASHAAGVARARSLGLSCLTAKSAKSAVPPLGVIINNQQDRNRRLHRFRRWHWRVTRLSLAGHPAGVVRTRSLGLSVCEICEICGSSSRRNHQQSAKSVGSNWRQGSLRDSEGPDLDVTQQSVESA
jgi:hypothetical protein